MHSPQNILYKTVLILAFIIGICLIVVIYFFIIYQRHFRKSNLRRVVFETETLENERIRLAADLHDELGPLISFCKIKAENLDPSNRNEPDIRELSLLLNEILSRIRWMSNVMMPETLLRQGVVFAIDEFIGKVKKDSRLSITFVAGNLPGIPPSTGIHIFRILQEIIHNTLKHARATSLRIELTSGHHQLLLRTADDGIGFDPSEQLKKSTGLGLRILNNRTTILGGDLNLQSLPGRGTCYHISIPFINQNV
jgi:signal transduction histidine kinase